MVRVGVIGTGWGRMYIGAFRAAGAEVVALCGNDLPRTQVLAEKDSIPLATDRVETLVAAVDAVVVASPDPYHFSQVQAALAQKRPVLCEKPLATSAQEAWKMAHLAQSAGVPAFVNFPYRSLSSFVALQFWLADKKIQEVAVTVRNGFLSGPKAAQSYDFGGVSHLVDAVTWLAGPPEWVFASLEGRPVKSSALILGGQARINLIHLSAPEPGIYGAWSILGDGWEVGFSASYVPSRGGWCISPIRALEGSQWQTLDPGAEPQTHSLEPWAQAHVETARKFLAALEGQTVALATFPEAAQTQSILSAAEKSDTLGRRIDLVGRLST